MQNRQHSPSPTLAPKPELSHRRRARDARAHERTGARRDTTREPCGRVGVLTGSPGLGQTRHGVAPDGAPCKGGRRGLGPEATQGAPRSSRPIGAGCCRADCHFHEKATWCQGGSGPELWSGCLWVVQASRSKQTTSPPRFHTHSEWVLVTRCTVGSVPYRGCHLTSGLDGAELWRPRDNRAVPRTGRKVEKVRARCCIRIAQAAWLCSGARRSGW